MLPEASKADLDFEALGQQMEIRKNELKTTGVPKTPEEEMIANAV